MQYLTIEQVTEIMRAAYKKNSAHHLMLLLSFQHGLRRSEIAALTLGDVQDGRICVSRVKGSLHTEQPLMTSPSVLFDEPKALATWLEERRAATDALFPCRRGDGPIKDDSVSDIAERYMQMAKIPEALAHHHSLKHALASLLIRSKVDLAYVKQALGHRSISSTIHYVHIQDSEATEKAQSAIQAALQ